MENTNEFKCEHKNVSKAGTKLLTRGRRYQLLKCNDCGYVFRTGVLL